MEKPKNNYFKNSIWFLLEKSSRIISGLLVGVLVARYLGGEQLGKLNYCLNVTAVFSIISNLGMDGIIVRELVKRHALENQIMGTAFRIRFWGALLAIASILVFSFFMDKGDHVLGLFLLISSSLIFQSFSVIDFHFQSQVKGKYVAINQVITLFTSAVIKLLLIYFHAPLIAFAGMIGLETLITAVNQYFFYRSTNKSISNWRYNSKIAGFLLKASLPLLLSGALMLIAGRIDNVLIKKFIGFDALGNYSAGIRISEAWIFIPGALSIALYPGVIHAANDLAFQRRRMKQISSLLFWMAIGVVVSTLLLGDWVIEVFYKGKFPMAAQSLKIHVWNNVPCFLGIAWSLMFNANNKQRFFLYQGIATIILSITLNLLFLPAFGVTGAAIAAVTSASLALLFIIILDGKNSILILLGAFNPINAINAIRYIRKKE